MISKIETAAGFPVIDRSSVPLCPTEAGREFIREAHQILQAAPGQTKPHLDPES
jgi:DNA-binding transcriptional LysR family regulator